MFLEFKMLLISGEQYFKSFRVSELIRIHKQLDEEFQLLGVSYKEIGNIFEKFKERFLIYCEVIAAGKPRQDFLSEQKDYNDSVR